METLRVELGISTIVQITIPEFADISADSPAGLSHEMHKSRE